MWKHVCVLKIRCICKCKFEHPGPRIWDVAYAVYRWIPFVSPKNPDYCYNLNEQIRRLKLFADTYDLKNHEREQLPNMIMERISSLVAYMRNEADSGNEDVRKSVPAV